MPVERVKGAPVRPLGKCWLDLGLLRRPGPNAWPVVRLCETDRDVSARPTASTRADRAALINAATEAWRGLPQTASVAESCLRRLDILPPSDRLSVLVPYLFPRDEPTLRRIFRVVRDQLSTSSADREATDKLQLLAIHLLDELLRSVRPSQLPELDASVREWGYWGWSSWEAWKQLQPTLPDELPTGAHGPALLALLTMHANGFVREAAVRRLSTDTPDFAFPYVLLRANDWVGPIRELSKRFVREFLQPGHEPIVSHALPLILKMNEYQRGEHSEMLHSLRNYLETESGAAALGALLSDGDFESKRAVVRFFMRSPEHLRHRFVEHAIQDRDPVVRLWAARQLETIEAGDPRLASSLRARMLGDSVSGIRLEAIYSLVRADPPKAAPELTQKLLDRSAAVRYAARYYLRQSSEAVDFRDFYQRNLVGKSKHLATVIAGIAETGTRDDVRVLQPLLAHRSAKVVRATLRARAKLDMQGTRSDRFAALVDPRSGVVQEALRLLGRRLASTDATTLKDLARQAKTPEAAGAVASLAARLPVWIDLMTLLSLTDPSNSQVADAAVAQLAAWEPRDRPSYGVRPPTPAVRNEIRAALESARSRLPLPVALELERSLKPFL